MNYCNFAKVLISRSTKDNTSIILFNKENRDPDEIHKPKYNTTISVLQRHANYQAFVHRYPKLHIPKYENFKNVSAKLTSYVYDKKYYQNKNKNGEKGMFLDQFSLYNWLKLKESEKKTACSGELSNLPNKIPEVVFITH